MTATLRMALIAGGLGAVAGMAGAQTTESRIVGDSGTGMYPITIVASNGATYRCKRELELRNGKRARICVPAAAGQGALAPGGAGAAVLGVLGLAAIATANGT